MLILAPPPEVLSIANDDKVNDTDGGKNRTLAGTGTYGLAPYGSTICFVCQIEMREYHPIRALGSCYHRNCFTCVACPAVIDSRSFAVIED